MKKSRKTKKPMLPMQHDNRIQGIEDRMFSICHIFTDIQNGPHPLTEEDIRKLIAKRPAMYGILACSRRVKVPPRKTRPRGGQADGGALRRLSAR